MSSAAITTRRLAMSRDEAETITNEGEDHGRLDDVRTPPGYRDEDLLDKAATLRRVAIPEWLVKAHHDQNVTRPPLGASAFRRIAIAASTIAAIATLTAVVLGFLLWRQGDAAPTARNAAPPPQTPAATAAAPIPPPPSSTTTPEAVPTTDSKLDVEPSPTAEKVLPSPGAIEAATISWYPVMVYLDDKLVGRLPLKLNPVPAGKHTIEFRGKGMQSEVRTFELGSGERLDLGHIKLKPIKVAFTLELIGEATLVTENQGREQRVLEGPWPMTRQLGLGTYTFVVVRPSIGPQTRVIVVTEESKAQTLRFEP